jgi:hypothetical protein
MPFRWQGWGIVRPWHAPPATRFTVWSYRTADTLNQVMAAGYFDPLALLDDVRREDWIIGFGAFDIPLELVIRDMAQHIVVAPLHDWFERTCAPCPSRGH